MRERERERECLEFNLLVCKLRKDSKRERVRECWSVEVRVRERRSVGVRVRD